jgi:hypothetical protein
MEEDRKERLEERGRGARRKIHQQEEGVYGARANLRLEPPKV